MDIILKKNSEQLKEGFYNLSSAENIADLLEIRYKDLIYYLYRLPICPYYIVKNITTKT